MKNFVGKFVLTVIVAVAFVFGTGQISKVFAQDVYCGNFPDGREAYLVMENIKGNLYYIVCQVKAVKNNRVDHVEYHFEPTDAGTVQFENSEGEHGIFGGVFSRRGTPYPLASKIFETAYSHIRNKH